VDASAIRAEFVWLRLSGAGLHVLRQRPVDPLWRHRPRSSVGVLTDLLAQRCDRLLAVDVSARAVSTTTKRLVGRSHVTVGQWQLPQWPTARFDLVVLSEVAYYLDAEDLTATLDAAVTSLEPAGDLVAVHWRHPVTDYPLTGEAVHAAIAARPASPKYAGTRRRTSSWRSSRGPLRRRDRWRGPRACTESLLELRTSQTTVGCRLDCGPRHTQLSFVRRGSRAVSGVLRGTVGAEVYGRQQPPPARLP
jgi:hypothetical protein